MNTSPRAGYLRTLSPSLQETICHTMRHWPYVLHACKRCGDADGNVDIVYGYAYESQALWHADGVHEQGGAAVVYSREEVTA